MTFTLTFAWWWIPAAITVVSIGWAMFIYDDGTRGMMSGLGNLFMLIPALFVSAVAWAIVGIMK